MKSDSIYLNNTFTLIFSFLLPDVCVLNGGHKTEKSHRRVSLAPDSLAV